VAEKEQRFRKRLRRHCHGFIQFIGSQIMEKFFTNFGGTFKILKELQSVMKSVFQCYPEAKAYPQ
jgi:hypothetical protein